MSSGAPAIYIGCLWVAIWLGVRSGFIPTAPGRFWLGWKLPLSQRSAQLLGYAGLALIGYGAVTLIVTFIAG
jgi:hypothetical protein